MLHVEGDVPVIVGHPALDEKGLVKVNKVGIAAEGLGEDVGLKGGLGDDAVDGFCRFSTGKFIILWTSPFPGRVLILFRDRTSVHGEKSSPQKSGRILRGLTCSLSIQPVPIISRLF
jgi:hypothetical protein